MVIDIIKKELKRVFTDRRLVISSFVLPAVSIYVIYSLMGSMIGGMVDDIESHTSRIYVSNAPDSFEQFYDEVKDNFNMNITFDGFDREDIIQSMVDKDAELLVEFGDDFDEMVTDYKNSSLPEIQTFYNPSEEYSSEARSNFVYGLLQGYEQALLSQRFDSLNEISAFAVDVSNENSSVVSEEKANASFLSMMFPMIIAIMLFSGAMGIGMDTIAGEKERGTMATLLLTPVKRESIALGKVIGLGIISIISSLCYFAATVFSLPKMAGGMADGNVTLEGLGFGMEHYLMLVGIMITLVGVYVGLVALISVMAKSMKEAGTYVTPVFLVIMVAAYSTMFARGDVALYRFAIPIYGPITAIKELFTLELGMNEFLISTGVSLGVTAILVYLITRAFNNERVMFNT